MKIFKSFARRYAAFKVRKQWERHAAGAAIGQLLSEQMCDQRAPNYLEMTFNADDGRQFVVNVRRLEGKTPHQIRNEEELKVARLTAQLNELIRTYKANTGNEPSLSVFHREIDRASELLAELEGGE